VALGQQQLVGIGADIAREVHFETRDDVEGDGDGAPTGRRLGWPDHDRVVPQRVHGPLHPNRGMKKVSVAPAQSQHLGAPQATPGGQQHQSPQSSIDGIGQGGDLAHGGDGALRAAILTRSAYRHGYGR
jgi:hypothetical protein